MKLDANAIFYLLSQEYHDVVGYVFSNSPLFDYPLLYDPGAQMNGHTVLVPDGIRITAKDDLRDVLCVCTGAGSALAASVAGHPVVHIRDDVSLQRIYNSMLESFLRHERFEAQLHAYVESHAGFRPILDACAAAMECACVLIDEHYHLVWQADGRRRRTESAEPLLDDESIELFMASREYRRMRASHRVFAAVNSTDLFLKNVFFNSDMVGTLAIAHNGDVTSARYARFLLNFLAPYVEEMYVRRGSFGTASVDAGKIRSMIQRAFKGEVVGFDELDELLKNSSGRWGEGNAPQPNSNGRYAVLQFARSFTNDTEGEFDYLIERIELAWPRAYCVVVEKGLFALVDLDGPSRDPSIEFMQDVVLFTRDSLVKVGMSRPFSSCSQLVTARLQAMAALEEGSFREPTYWFYRFDDYALQWLISHGRGQSSLELVMHPAILFLRAYDKEHGSNLEGTLREFMRCRYNASEAATRLYIARSTLLNRLERIQEMTNIDLRDFRERIYLGISLELFE